MTASEPSRRLGALDPDAIRDSLPLLVPAIPFGFILGVEINRSLMPTIAGFSTSQLIFAGAAQLAVITLAGTVSAVTVILTAAVINARHVMYSAALAPAMSKQPRWFRIVAPFVLVDQIFALSLLQQDREPNEFRRYYITCGILFFVVWQGLTIAGIAFGDAIPDSLGLGLAPALMFAGIVVSMIANRPAFIAATTAVAVTFASLGLPNRSGILVGAFAGVLAGYLAEGRSR